MRRDIALPALSVAGGVAGFFLRRWQLSCAYVPETGLFVHGAPATYLLLGLIALIALTFLLLVRHKKGPDDYLPAFGWPEAGQMTALTAAGLLLLAAGALGLRDGLVQFQLWRSAPELYQLSSPVTQLLTGLLCIPAGLGVLLMGKMAYREKLDDAACWLAPFPALAGVVWLFASHLRTGTQPVLMKYGFQLAAVCLLTLAHYYVAGFLFGRLCRQRALLFALLGPVLGLISLADRPDLFTAAALLAFSLSALTFAHALLRALFGPPRPKRLVGRMPPPEEEEAE